MRFTEILCKSENFRDRGDDFCPDLNVAGFSLVAGTKHTNLLQKPKK